MKNLILLLPILFSTVAIAEVKTWENPECLSGDCEVRSIKLYVEKNLSRTMGMKSVIAEVKTSRPEQLRKYAFVQYIKGCVFDSNAQGPIRHGIRRYLGKDGQPFVHPVWQIDNQTLDPIYWSTRNPGWDDLRGFEIPRNANYLVTSPANGKEERWGGKVSNIVDNRLFILDQPTPGTVGIQGGKPKATNSSLEFKMCLYAIADLPEHIDDPSVEYPNPVACLDWDSRFHYNFASKKFVEASSIHPYCRL